MDKITCLFILYTGRKDFLRLEPFVFHIPEYQVCVRHETQSLTGDASHKNAN